MTSQHIEKARRLMLAKWLTQRYKFLFLFLFDFLEVIPGKKFLRNNASFQNVPVLTKKDIWDIIINFALCVLWGKGIIKQLILFWSFMQNFFEWPLSECKRAGRKLSMLYPSAFFVVLGLSPVITNHVLMCDLHLACRSWLLETLYHFFFW